MPVSVLPLSAVFASPVPSLCQHEEELPQNMRPGVPGEKSKSALKNQKKREAKKAARQVS